MSEQARPCRPAPVSVMQEAQRHECWPRSNRFPVDAAAAMGAAITMRVLAERIESLPMGTLESWRSFRDWRDQVLGLARGTILDGLDIQIWEENRTMSENPDIPHGLRMGDVPRAEVAEFIQSYIAGIRDLSPDDRPDVFEALAFIARQVSQ